MKYYTWYEIVSVFSLNIIMEEGHIIHLCNPNNKMARKWEVANHNGAGAIGFEPPSHFPKNHRISSSLHMKKNKKIKKEGKTI